MNYFKRNLGIGDKDFYATFFKLSIPIMIQQGLSSMLFLVDNIMIGSLGVNEIAAVGIATQMSFLSFIFNFGICSGAGVLTAQYWGRRDLDSIAKVEGLALTCTTVLSLIMMSIIFFGKEQIMGIYSKDPAVIALGMEYLSIMCFGYFAQNLTQTMGSILKSCGIAKLSMISTGVCVIVNCFFNYCFIFGNLGFPKLGVAGAALATLIASFCDVIFVFTITYISKNVAANSLKKMFAFFKEKDMVKKFIIVCLPVFINELLWSVGTTLYTVVYGQIGTDAVAAIQIYKTIDSLNMVFLLGVGTSCAVMVGNKIGEGKEELAKQYGYRFLHLAVLGGLALGGILILITPYFLTLYNITESVYNNAYMVITICAASVWIHAFNHTNIIGLLRAAGNTILCTKVDLSGLWLVSLPLMSFVGLVLNAPLWMVFLATIPGDLFKAIYGYSKIRKGTWIRNLTQ